MLIHVQFILGKCYYNATFFFFFLVKYIYTAPTGTPIQGIYVVWVGKCLLKCETAWPAKVESHG